MREQITFYLLLAAVVYGFYRAYRKKSEKLFYGLLLILFAALSRFPFYLRLEFCLALWSFLGFGSLFYKWKVKKLDESLIVFSLMFLAIGVVSILKGLDQMDAMDPVLAFLFAK